jgi:hypothetical protein
MDGCSGLEPSLFEDRGSGDTLAHPANFFSMTDAVEAAELYSGGSRQVNLISPQYLDDRQLRFDIAKARKAISVGKFGTGLWNH